MLYIFQTSFSASPNHFSFRFDHFCRSLYTLNTYPKSYSFLVGLTTYLVIGPYICFLIVFFFAIFERASDLILSSINNRARRHFMMQNYIPIKKNLPVGLCASLLEIS